MANDPEEKQPSASPKDEPSAVKSPAATGEPAAKPTVPPAAPAAKPPAPGGVPPAPAAKPPAAAAPPKPPAPPKEGPVALDNDLVKRYKQRFGDAIREAWIDRKQSILVVARERLVEIATYSRNDEKSAGLGALTPGDWQKPGQ